MRLPGSGHRRVVRLVCVLSVCAGSVLAQELPDYTVPARAWPRIYKPYIQPRVPVPNLANQATKALEVQDGKVHITMAQLAALVVENNLTVASARYFPSIAQTDLLRARSGNSPRGVDVSQIPSGVFSGAVGGSILGTAGGSGGGSQNAGGITGNAGRVTVRPAGLFDPSLSLSFSMDHTSSPLNTTVVAGVPSVTTTTGVFSVNYVQSFPSGTSFSVSYGMQHQNSTQLHLLYDPAITPGFTATVSQQLMNKFGFAVNRALIKVAENEQKIERDAFRQQVITALVTAQNTYWDLVAAREAVRSAEKAVAVAQQLEKENQRQLEIGTMARLDVVSAQSQVAASRRDLIVAQTAMQNLELQLKAMISRTLQEPFASATIETDPLPDPDGVQIPDVGQAKARALENRPDLAIAEVDIKSQVDAMPFIRNSLLPSVTVFGLVTTVGLFNEFGTSFIDAVHFKYPEVAFGMTVSFPFRNRQAQADEVRSTLTLKQSRDTLVRSKNQVGVDVENAIIALRQAKAQVGAAREAVRLEQQKTDAEQQKLQLGISTSYNVILVQRDLFAAELAETQARNALAKAGVSLAQATGSTLEAAHVNLDEALRGRLSSEHTQ